MPPKTKPAAKKPTPKAKVATPKATAFKQVLILAQGPDVLAAEAELRLRTVARHIGVEALPPVLRIPHTGTTPLATGLALYQLFRATGRGGPALYIAGGAADHGALSLLTTDWGNAVLAPNDGTPGTLVSFFQQRKIPFTLHQLALDSLISAEQHRMENPEWEPSFAFALRDVLAPAAAALLGGLPFASLAQTGTKTNATGLTPHIPPFASKLQPLPMKLNTPIPVLALKQAEGPHLLNLTLDALSFQQLVDDRAAFTLTLPPRGGLLPLRHTHTLTATEHPTPTPHLGLSPLPAPAWDESFLTLSVSCTHPCWADPIVPLTLTRTR